MVIKICIFCLVLMVVLPSRCAPRSKHSKPQTVYDQKQTGDYNIQLHLKDFQIIALLTDDAIGSLGDYDYNYDYADFTVKPVTQKPSDPTTSRPAQTSSNPQGAESQPTVKPADHPYPILAPSTTQPPKETPVVIEEKPANIQDKPDKESISNEADKTETSTTTAGVSETVESISSTSPRTEKKDEANSPGKIKVQIIGSPENVGAIPGEEMHDKNNDAAPQVEVMQLRRCGTGFARDKKGRCRRIRRPGAVSPQLPYGFSRLATNLASKFRYTASDTSQSSSSESTED